MKGASKGRSRPWLLVVVVFCCVLGAVVQACGGGDSGGGGGSTKKVDMAAELKKPANITVWAWTPGTQDAVNMFEKAYPNINVKLQNVGQGPPHYRKVRTVLKSGKGLPDVIQMEFQYIPSFTITKSLLDMTPYLPKDFLSKYPEWIQKQINLRTASTASRGTRARSASSIARTCWTRPASRRRSRRGTTSPRPRSSTTRPTRSRTS